MTRFSFALLTALSLPLAAFAQENDTSAPPALAEEVTTVLATVNGTEITLGHVIDIRNNLPQQYQQLPPPVLLNGILEQIIDQVLLADKAEELGLDDGAVMRVMLENQRRTQLSAAYVSDIAATGVSEDAIVAAHAAAIEGLEPTPEYNASHILVPTEEEAAALITQLVDGADFATLAEENSIGPSGPRGGQLGWFGPGQMVPAFEAAVQSLAVGEISAPVETQFGWHVVILNETRMTNPPTLEEMRAELVSQLQQDALSAAVAALRADAEILRPEGVMNPEALNTVELSE